jgi:hypothetical protein
VPNRQLAEAVYEYPLLVAYVKNIMDSYLHVHESQLLAPPPVNKRDDAYPTRVVVTTGERPWNARVVDVVVYGALALGVMFVAYQASMTQVDE